MHNWWDMPFGFPTSVLPLYLVFPFIFHQAVLQAQQTHINVLIFPICTFLEHIKMLHYLKHLRYFRGTGQAYIQYFKCKIWVKRSLKWAHQHMSPDSSHFILKSSTSFWQIKLKTKLNVCYAPFGGILNAQHTVANLHDSSSRGWLTPNTRVDITLIEQLHNTHCIATCYT